MRFMMIVKSNPSIDAGQPPSAEDIAAMGRYNQELADAGILLAMEGLAGSSKGAKVQFLAGGKTRVVDGPFAEAKELIAGFWVIQVKDLSEALAWARRIPMPEGQEIEVRQVHRLSDFDEDLVTEDHRRREQAWRDRHDKPVAN